MPMTRFCVTSYIPQSPKWPKMASLSAQYGNGAAKQMSELLYSINCTKDNSDITLEGTAEAGVQSRDTGKEKGPPYVAPTVCWQC